MSEALKTSCSEIWKLATTLLFKHQRWGAYSKIVWCLIIRCNKIQNAIQQISSIFSLLLTSSQRDRATVPSVSKITCISCVVSSSATMKAHFAAMHTQPQAVVEALPYTVMPPRADGLDYSLPKGAAADGQLVLGFRLDGSLAIRIRHYPSANTGVECFQRVLPTISCRRSWITSA